MTLDARVDVETHATLLHLESMLAARSDVDGVLERLATDFLEIGASGTIYDRAAAIATMKSGANPATAPRIENFETRFVGVNLVLATYFDASGGVRRASLWRCEDGDWRLAFHQGTRVEDA